MAREFALVEHYKINSKLTTERDESERDDDIDDGRVKRTPQWREGS